MNELPTGLSESLDGYTLIRFLGSGGFGQVWLCRSEAMGDYRAFKWIPATNEGRLEKEYTALLNYRKAAAALRSPALVPIEHVGRNQAGLYYIMPLADGLVSGNPTDPGWSPLSLADKLCERAGQPSWLSSGEIIELMSPVLEGLQTLSDAGLVHRDVKPDNILFFNGKPCLGDISLLGEDLTTITRHGTPGYTTPSWYQKGHPDMYGAAATLYSILTGNSPDRMGRSAFLWPPQGEDSLSAEQKTEWKRLHQVVRRATEEKVAERYIDFRAMNKALTGKSLVGATNSPKKATILMAGLAVVAISFFAFPHLQQETPSEQPDVPPLKEEPSTELPELTPDQKADYTALVAMVMGYIQDGNNANALASVEELLATYPQARTQPAYSVARAMALEGLGRIEEAKEELRREINLSSNITAMTSRIDLWKEMDDLEGAENDLTRVIDSFGAATFPLFHRADIRALRGDFAGVQSDRETAYQCNQRDPGQRRLVDAMWTPLETKYPGYGTFLGKSVEETSEPQADVREHDAPSSPQPNADRTKVEILDTVFVAPATILRSPRDYRKANSLLEDARLAYNAVAYFAGETSPLNAAEKTLLRRALVRIDLHTRDDNNFDFPAAIAQIDAATESIPTLQKSGNIRLARLLLESFDSDTSTINAKTNDPSFKSLGEDDLGYRVELMNRHGMDLAISALLDGIIASNSPDDSPMIIALVERARQQSRYNQHEGCHSDIEAARLMAGDDQAALAWIRSEEEDLKRTNPKYADYLKSLQEK